MSYLESVFEQKIARKRYPRPIPMIGMIHDAAIKKKLRVLVPVVIQVAVRAYFCVYYKHAVKIMVCPVMGRCALCELCVLRACFVALCVYVCTCVLCRV